MISIKKFLDETIKSKPGDHFDSPIVAIVGAYRSALGAVARAVSRNGSPYGAELESRLIGLDRRIASDPSVDVVRETAIEFETNIALWSQRAFAEASAKDSEIKELILALAKTAETLVVRDKKTASQFGALTGQLEKIGDLSNVRQIRTAILERVTELRSTIEQVNQENRQFVSELESKVTTFETRLKSAENLALTDALTGVANRRCLEDRMTYNIEHHALFCVVLFDLNRFKDINDTFGHNAGDDLLRQFAARLKQKSRATDLVGRWGGDEFVLVLSGAEKRVRPLIRRLQKEVSTRYMLHGGDRFYSAMDIDAAVGVAEWQSDESMSQVITRADAEMYQDKSRMKDSRAAVSE